MHKPTLLARSLLAFFHGSLVLLAASHLAAQSNSVDPIFGGISLDLYGTVGSVATQPDAKILVVGGRNGLGRLETDGTVDTGFLPVAQGCRALALQTNGKVLIGGIFTQVNGTARNYLARLNADGTLDSGFAPTLDSDVFALALQPDGKILVGGDFSTVNGTTRNYLARLDTDGSLDTEFDAGINYAAADPITGGGADVTAIVIQPDGEILIAGGFEQVRSVSHLHIARVNTDGSLDTGFNPSVYGLILTMALQPDAKVLIGGQISSVSGTSRSNLVRLTGDGSVDATFVTSADDYVELLYPRPDGTILVGGNFSAINGTAHGHLARLTANGSLDTTFTPTSDDRVRTAAAEQSGRVVIGGVFSQVGGLPRNSVALLDTNGSVDTSFIPDLAPGANGTVDSVAALTDGRMLLSGDFTQVTGAAHSHLARLKADGTIDPTFTASSDLGANAIAVQPDGKILIGGGFTTVDGISRNQLARLNADGTLDTAFLVNFYGATSVLGLALQGDGKIVLVGTFQEVNGVMCTGVARVTSGGALDYSFNATLGGGPFGIPFVYAVAIQADGKILVGSSCTQAGGETHNHLARLNTDGSVDSSFNADLDGNVSAITVQADGKILVGGSFSTVDGVSMGHAARLNADGSLDSAFTLNVFPPGDEGYVDSIVVKSDGKILLSAAFADSNTSSYNKIVHLLPDGSVDPFFNADRGTDGAVYALARLPDDRVLLGGDFTTYDTRLRNHIAMLKADGAPDFFGGRVDVGGGFYYLEFSSGNPFGYFNVAGSGYSFPYLYHADLGFEYFFDAQDGYGGGYLYDFRSAGFFYTSPAFPFPYLYDFSLNTVLYYYPDPDDVGHYNTNGVRYFYRFDTGGIISK